MPDAVPGHPTPGMHLWGWMAPVELEWLIEQAAQMESVVEVGSLHGRSAFALLGACPGPVYCIDPWDDVKDECYGSFMGACGHFPNLVPVRGYSPAAGALVPGDVDMTFIDGNHDWDSIMADIGEWLPRTRRLICGHDYQNANGGYPDVERAVREVFGDCFFNPEGTSIWAVDVPEAKA